MIKHIVFDLFGTLADCDDSKLSVKRGALMNFGHKTWMRTGNKAETYFEEFCEKNNCDLEELRKSFYELESTAEFFEGVRELLTELKGKRLEIHLLSNTGQTIESFIEKRKEMFDLFDTLTFSYQEKLVKPDHELFRRVFDRIGTEPNECIMIGDSKEADIKPADELGMKTIHFSGRFESIEKLREQINQIIQ